MFVRPLFLACLHPAYLLILLLSINLLLLIYVLLFLHLCSLIILSDNIRINSCSCSEVSGCEIMGSEANALRFSSVCECSDCRSSRFTPEEEPPVGLPIGKEVAPPGAGQSSVAKRIS